ncbi:unnamed protein product [Heligmosomoides polygyrus]|uniref:DUF4230 domain-containing protein n=1 Tax=Heligmosomoides polygyrus TaxID=6339 RepID=A0A183G7C6_HELPZ|nr:unnamed protein product [Heligmosomoides polygyrus]
MRWPDFIVKAAASIACLIIWRYTLRFLAARIPTISGEEAYFPSHLVDDDKALNSYRLSIAEQSYQRAIKEADHANVERSVALSMRELELRDISLGEYTDVTSNI